MTSIDSFGNEAMSSLTFADILDVIPPAAPKNLFTMADTGNISLFWDKNTEFDLLGYRVYRTVNANYSDKFVLINAIPCKDNRYIDSLPVNAKNTFFYKVVAVDTNYNVSEFSNVSISRIPDIIPPEKPYIMNISYTDEELIIEWLKNAEPDLMGYSIYRIDSHYSSKEIVTERLNVNLLAPSVTRYTDRWAVPNKDYFYFITTLDSTGNISNPSDTIMARLVKEEQSNEGFKNIKIKYRDRQVMIQFEPNETKEEHRRFVIYRRSEEDIYKPITGLMTDKKYTDTKIEEDKVYYYEIRAYSNKGVTLKSREIRIVTNDKNP